MFSCPQFKRHFIFHLFLCVFVLLCWVSVFTLVLFSVMLALAPSMCVFVCLYRIWCTFLKYIQNNSDQSDKNLCYILECVWLLVADIAAAPISIRFEQTRIHKVTNTQILSHNCEYEATAECSQTWAILWIAQTLNVWYIKQAKNEKSTHNKRQQTVVFLYVLF